MKQIVVFLADGFEEIEALSPVDYLRRAGAEVITAATGKSVREVNGAHGITVLADTTLDEYLSGMKALPDAVVCPGGMPGASNIAACGKAVELIRTMNESGRLVAAICASPAIVLPATGALKGKEWTCYPGMQSNAAEYVSSYKNEVFVTDGNLVTSRGPGAAEQFAMELVRILCGEDTALNVRTGSCQR